MQILDWSLQLIQVIANKDKILDISIVRASDDLDPTDYVTRTLTKVSVSLSGVWYICSLFVFKYYKGNYAAFLLLVYNISQLPNAAYPFKHNKLPNAFLQNSLKI